MKRLNFYERAVLCELVKQSEEGVLSRSYQQIANEIGKQYECDIDSKFIYRFG